MNIQFEQRGGFDVSEKHPYYILKSLPVRISKGDLKVILNIRSMHTWWKYYFSDDFIEILGFESKEEFKRIINFSPEQTKIIYEKFNMIDVSDYQLKLNRVSVTIH